MMVGTLICIGGLLLFWISPYTTESTEVEPGMYVSEVKWWYDIMPFIIPIGLLLFSIGYLFDSLKNKNESNTTRDQIASSETARD